MRVLVVIGVLLCLVGAVFLLQGINVLHGSTMSGHGFYAVLGGAMFLIGLALLVRTRRSREARNIET
jgi:MYXO-CTERM domain-containing protein